MPAEAGSHRGRADGHRLEGYDISVWYETGAVEIIAYKSNRVDLGCEKNPADLRVAKVVDEQLTADLSWTAGGGEEVFIGSGPPEDEKMALNVIKQWDEPKSHT